VHDYDSADGKVHVHLTPALTILYSLGVAQSAFFIYRGLCDRVARTGLVEEVAGDYRLDAGIVSEYLDETVTGCMKDPSFARGRNLVTYAVDLLLMEPTSTSTSTTTTTSSRSRSCSSKYLSGLAILGSILHLQRDDTDTTRPWLHEQPTT
jgi:hypothetical protein